MRVREGWVVFAALAAALAAACAISLFAGAAGAGAAGMIESPIIRLRAARIALAVTAGAGLSVSGAVFQALLRNPLAEPYVLGVSSGAGVAAAAAIVLRLGFLGSWTLPGSAFVGALVTIVLVYVLARRGDGTTPVYTLILSGVIVSALAGSALTFLVSISQARDLHSVLWWMLGNLQVYEWGLLRAVSAVVCGGLLVAVVCARQLDVMALGEETAASLGLETERTKALFFVVASLMTGATVAACGLIAFVGLIVPHAMRHVVGPHHRRLLPGSALAGATLLVLSDCLGRTLLAPTEIPVGVVTAFLGGPFFLFLLRRGAKSSWA